MKWLDWLLRRTPVASVSPAVESPPESEEPFDPDATTFIKGRLTPKAQAEIKRLREFKDHGATKYNWVCSQYACFESKKFASEGPYDIAMGLSRISPIPGRETSKCECDCFVEVAGD